MNNNEIKVIEEVLRFMKEEQREALIEAEEKKLEIKNERNN